VKYVQIDMQMKRDAIERVASTRYLPVPDRSFHLGRLYDRGVSGRVHSGARGIMWREAPITAANQAGSCHFRHIISHGTLWRNFQGI
jgi:hypothetical protein